MALKDWERDTYGTYINKKSKDEIDIEFGQIGNNPKKWFVFKNGKKISPERGLTESQALSYAKQYMRTH